MLNQTIAQILVPSTTKKFYYEDLKWKSDTEVVFINEYSSRGYQVWMATELVITN